MLASNQKLREAELFAHKLGISKQGLFQPTKMSLPDGDLAVIDDLFSLREYNNFLKHFAGAGAIGNPQAGVIQFYTGTKVWKGHDGSAWIGISKIAQVITDTDTAQATVATGFPNDDTLPQRNEGDERMACAITPQNASSTILIIVTINGYAGNDDWPIACLFRSDSMDTIAFMGMDDRWNIGTKTMQWLESAGSTDARTYSTRVGGKTGQDYFTNDEPAALFATAKKSTMVVMEILP